MSAVSGSLVLCTRNPIGSLHTCYLNIKGRRTYMGQDIPYSRTLELQVGSPQHTRPNLDTGRCASCHRGPSALDKINHASANLGTCAGCHVPLGFELEGPIYVRTHFIHSRSHRFGAPLDRCASCHLTPQSIQRTAAAESRSSNALRRATRLTATVACESGY